MILVNGVKFNDEQFHNGEVIFKETSIVNKDINKIEMKFKDNRDITALLFARQWLKDVVPKAKCVLVMEYCPYERMDRKINDQLFSMRYFAQILGKFEFCEVYILDPHSRVCWDEIEYAGLPVAVCNLDYYLDKVKDEFRPDYICYPDKGAYEKYPKYIRHNDIPYFYGDKKRDLANKGKIIGYELVNAPDLKDKKVLIIDDICCLGGTAYNAAIEMKKAGASKVAFYISHCEDGIFAGKILKKEPFYPDLPEANLPWRDSYTIDKVYTADTMGLSKTHENIVIVK